MTLNDCIEFKKIEHPYEHKSNALGMESLSHS